MGARVPESASEAWTDEDLRHSVEAGTAPGVELAYTLAGLEEVFQGLTIS